MLKLGNIVGAKINADWSLDTSKAAIVLSEQKIKAHEEQKKEINEAKITQQAIQEKKATKLKEEFFSWQHYSDYIAEWEPHQPLTLLRYAEFMASKYQNTPQTKDWMLQYNDDNKEKYKKIWAVISLFIDSHKVPDAGGLIPAIREELKRHEKIVEKNPREWLTWDKLMKREMYEEENIDNYYSTIEFLENAMKSPLGKPFEERLEKNPNWISI